MMLYLWRGLAFEGLEQECCAKAEAQAEDEAGSKEIQKFAQDCDDCIHAETSLGFQSLQNTISAFTFVMLLALMASPNKYYNVSHFAKISKDDICVLQQ